MLTNKSANNVVQVVFGSWWRANGIATAVYTSSRVAAAAWAVARMVTTGARIKMLMNARAQKCSKTQ